MTELDSLAVNFLLCIVLTIGVIMTMLGLPGNILIFISSFVYGYYDRFIHVGSTALWILFAIYVCGELAEFLAAAVGAKRGKASKLSMFAAFLGALGGGVAGTAILPVLGSFAGAMIGAFAASYAVEFSQTGDSHQAQTVAINVMIGQLFGMVFKFIVAIGMSIYVISRLPWH